MEHFTNGFLGVVAVAALRSVAFAAAAGILLSVVRVKNVALRLTVWKVVLWGALAMPLLAWALPTLHFELPRVITSQFERFGLSGARTESATRSATPESGNGIAANRVEVPRRLTASTSAGAAQRSDRAPANAAATRPLNFAAQSPATVPQQPAKARTLANWNGSSGARIALALYFAIAALLSIRLLVGWILGRRLIRAAIPIRDPRASLSLSLRAFPGHLKEAPLLAESEALSVPVTLGVARPVILLPVDWREWDGDKLNAVLAHELSHIGRNDALTQRLAKLHRAIYWFSPLPWWLDRQLARLAEEASDEAALASGADRQRYAETLLRFFEAIRAASGRVWWQGVSMAAGGDAAKRVDRILSWKGVVTMRLRKPLAALLGAAALPMLFAVASIHFTASAAQQAPKPHVAPVPALPPAPGLAPVPQLAPVPALAPLPALAPMPEPTAVSGPLPSVPPVIAIASAPASQSTPRAWPVPQVVVSAPAFASTAPLPPSVSISRVEVVAPALARAISALRALAPQSPSGNSDTYVMDDEHVRDPYIISTGTSYIVVLNHSVTISDSGDGDELAHAKALRSKIGGDFIWFAHAGKAYVIRDRATIDRAAELYKPMNELSAQQDELGKQQDELGKQQDDLGEQMEEVKLKIPDMSADLERVKQQMRELSEKGGTQSELGELQAALGELQARIGEIQSEAGRQQSGIGRRQGELGRKQGELGRRQGELGRKQGEISKKATQQVEGMLDEARTKGLAQPE